MVDALISLACTTMLAYALSKPGTLATRPILFTVLFSLLFTPGVIPRYLMVKELGLLVNNAQLSAGALGAVGAAPPRTSLQMAILVISIVPVLVVYPFMRRYFAEGVLVGAVKG